MQIINFSFAYDFLHLIVQNAYLTPQHFPRCGRLPASWSLLCIIYTPIASFTVT